MFSLSSQLLRLIITMFYYVSMTVYGHGHQDCTFLSYSNVLGCQPMISCCVSINQLFALFCRDGFEDTMFEAKAKAKARQRRGQGQGKAKAKLPRGRVEA